MLKQAILAGLVASASAHLVMTNPSPFGAPSNSPLYDNGTNFPCKNADYSSIKTMNEYAQGSKQKLKFRGSVVHGGGSCQVSVTTDQKPSKNSVWKVIKSIEGGCPAKDIHDNIHPPDENMPTPFEYDFTIPKDLAAGKYVIAWTWFNNIGNREMYMNCGPLTVTGSGGSKGFMDTLPNMFVANIGNGCGTLPETDVKFPDPGKDLDQFGQKTPQALKGPTGACASAGPRPTGGSQPSGASGAGGAPQPTSAPESTAAAGDSSAAAPPVATSGMSSAAAPPAASGTIPGGVFVTTGSDSPPAPTGAAGGPSSMPAPTSADAPPAASSQESAPPAPTGANSTAPDASGTCKDSGGFAAGSACNSEGTWNCIGGTSFQRCAGGKWSAPQNVASGTKCTPGQSADIKINVIQLNERRHRRSPRP
ncbi:Chitin-binding, domain 3 [Metarhizium rileyi]|uniref:Chitin-binding, domain 3 n=1 Tax=Metarhizium rileyi (strain RCEF 4871) TaxID=1649241 RepID=A0A162JTI8_METRR|nr:Chitin-binding, domain 3 [Metarhizium rileyi RCEF 4871]